MSDPIGASGGSGGSGGPSGVPQAIQGFQQALATADEGGGTDADGLQDMDKAGKAPGGSGPKIDPPPPPPPAPTDSVQPSGDAQASQAKNGQSDPHQKSKAQPHSISPVSHTGDARQARAA